MTNSAFEILVGSLPADWAALGAEQGYHPKEAEDLRFWIAGMTGEGKSTFSRSVPGNITLDFGDETGGIFEPRDTRIHIRNYDHYTKVTEKLIEEGKAGKARFNRFTIDNVDDWVMMIVNQLQQEKKCEDITEYGSQGSGYNLIRNRAWARFQQLVEAGYTWSCSANLREKQVNLPGGKSMTMIRPVVFDSFASMFGRRADYKLVIYAENKVVKLTKRVKVPGTKDTYVDQPIGEETRKVYHCQCRSSDTREAKTRGVPEMEETFELPLVDGWKVFKQKYDEAKARAIAKEKELSKENSDAGNGPTSIPKSPANVQQGDGGS